MRRITILLAAMAALMLVPAAQAFAGEMHVTIAGAGEGEVESSFYGFIEGSPPLACTYDGSSQAGTCDNTLESAEECEGFGFSGQCEVLHAAPEEESESRGFVTKEGVEINENFEHAKCTSNPGPNGVETVCFFEGAPNAQVEAVFCLVGESLEECLPSGPVNPTALTVAKTGEGTIASSPAGIECGATCSHEYEKNEVVTLTASPASGNAFNSWAGCTTHVGLTCTVEMSKAKTVKASFIATPSLSVEKAGTGQGKVSATGIGCDENCSKAASAVKAGTTVTFKVTSAKGSEAAVFESGTGSASACSGGSCTFTISENSSVKVKFNAVPTKTMTVNLTGPAKYKGKVTGKGIVKGLTGSAVNCGSGCTTQTESFFSTDEVTLSAAPSTGYTFGGWSVSGGSAGTCTGTTTPCTVKTDANKTISAEFK